MKFQQTKRKPKCLDKPFHVKMILYKAFSVSFSNHFYFYHYLLRLSYSLSAPLFKVYQRQISRPLQSFHNFPILLCSFPITIGVYMWVCVQWEISDQSGLGSFFSQVSCLWFGASVIKPSQNQTNNTKTQQIKRETHRTIIWHRLPVVCPQQQQKQHHRWMKS